MQSYIEELCGLFGIPDARFYAAQGLEQEQLLDRALAKMHID